MLPICFYVSRFCGTEQSSVVHAVLGCLHVSQGVNTCRVLTRYDGLPLA